MNEKKFYDQNWKEIQRTSCQVYTRVMGYLRPVNNYNIWKKSEFYSRNYFKNDKIIDNSDFLEKYEKANYYNVLQCADELVASSCSCD
jgi:hypothetical protein